MRSLGWSAEVIQKYTVDHAHQVNEENAAKHWHNPPDLPKNDDAKWLSQHPKLPGSGKAPQKQLKPKSAKKDCDGNRRSKEASQIQTRNSCTVGDLVLPKVN